MKRLQGNPQGAASMVCQLDETALAVCQAMGVSPKDYLDTLNT